MAKYNLPYTGSEVEGLLGDVPDKEDKVAGKGLSTNDYTNADKEKLAGIAAGAEVNVNADWEAQSGDAQILHKPTSMPNPYTFTLRVNGNQVSVYDGSGAVIADISVPTRLGQLENDRNFITRGVSDLINYYAKDVTYTKEQVNTLISSIRSLEFVLVDTLPQASPATISKIYLVPSASPQLRNQKDEYVTIINNGVYSWEQIGSTAIDLSGYQKTEDKVSAINDSNKDSTAKYSSVKAVWDLVASKIQDALTLIGVAMNTKANKSEVYTKTAADALLAAKANSADVYNMTAVDSKLDTRVCVVNESDSADGGTLAGSGMIQVMSGNGVIGRILPVSESGECMYEYEGGWMFSHYTTPFSSTCTWGDLLAELDTNAKPISTVNQLNERVKIVESTDTYDIADLSVGMLIVKSGSDIMGKIIPISDDAESNMLYESNIEWRIGSLTGITIGSSYAAVIDYLDDHSAPVGKGLYIANWEEQPSYSEIASAIENGQTVAAIKDGLWYSLARYDDALIVFANFTDAPANKLRIINIIDTDWEYLEYGVEGSGNKITTLTNFNSNRNSTTFYPANKAIADYIAQEIAGKASVSDLNTLGGRVTTIEGKIPAQATSANQLADKNFVNSSIATNTATFRGTFDCTGDGGAVTLAKVEGFPTTNVDVCGGLGYVFVAEGLVADPLSFKCSDAKGQLYQGVELVAESAYEGEPFSVTLSRVGASVELLVSLQTSPEGVEFWEIQISGADAKTINDAFVESDESIFSAISWNNDTGFAADKNDYAYIVVKDNLGNKSYARWKYTTGWAYEYILNNSSFTANQWAAINSGITASLVAQIGAKEIFVAEYNSTTYSNVKAAYDAGKTIIVKIASSGQVCYGGLTPSDPTSSFAFITPVSNGVIITEVSASGWSIDTNTYENINNRRTSLSNQSTNTEYPTAKCVYDALQLKQDIITDYTVAEINSLCDEIL